MTFPKGQTPPVDAFWSTSMYDAEKRLMVGNSLNRYKIGGADERGLVVAVRVAAVAQHDGRIGRAGRAQPRGDDARRVDGQFGVRGDEKVREARRRARRERAVDQRDQLGQAPAQLPLDRDTRRRVLPFSSAPEPCGFWQAWFSSGDMFIKNERPEKKCVSGNWKSYSQKRTERPAINMAV